MPTPDLRALLASWELSLKAERKSPQTIRSYCGGVELFLTWCEANGHPSTLDRPTVQAWIVSQLDAGREANTAQARHHAARRFSAWLFEEGEIDTDEIVNLKPPKSSKKVVPRLTEDEIRALIATCGRKTFVDRRDEAILRFMLETPSRAGEIIAMNLPDVDLRRGIAKLRGKGDKERTVPFGPTTARAIDRYIRSRATHKLATPTGKLWLGNRNTGFTYYALWRTMRQRADQANLPHFHPHLTRHTSAQRWLSAGGSEGGLMSVAGWTSRAMLTRYTEATAAERAAEEARKLNLGDF